MTQNTEKQEREYPTKLLVEFLESTPPNSWVQIEKITTAHPQRLSAGSLTLDNPEIQLHCTNERCNGVRFFHAKPNTAYLEFDKSEKVFVEYICRNCQMTKKIFALLVVLRKENNYIVKLGEYPEFGPPTPSRVIKLLGPDREIYLKGRRAENQGLGIGAFGYYRRVVENQKSRIFDEISRVSVKLNASSDLIKELELAKNEIQFSKAIDQIRHGIPAALLINGHNPLTLLHSALSEGIHAQSDEDCLEIATSIRVVLSELAERIGQALKDEKELNNAVSRLLQKKSPKNDQA
jgi:hypothetical protein